MKKIVACLLFVLYLTSGNGQIPVRTVVPVNVNMIEYPNLTGNTRSSQPHQGIVTLKDGTSVKGKITVFKKKDVLDRVKVKTEEDKVEIAAAQIASIALDPKVHESKYPNNFKKPEKNFQPGYVVLPGGQKLPGKVAQVRDFSDYDFFTYTILFLPDGSGTASSLKGGSVSEFGQMIDGTMRIWDGYADGYLLRMVDGRYRLSRNPYSETKNEFFTSLKKQATDSLGKQVAQKALAQGLVSGKNINESIENAADAGSTVAEVVGSIEIKLKEYLIFDTRTNSVVVVNRDSFRDYAQRVSASCGVPAELIAWDKIVEFVKNLNANCP